MKWKIVNKSKSEEILKILLENRGIKTKKQIEEFLHSPDPHRLTPEQVGLSTSQIARAIKRIMQAVKKKEKIIVYGDYDADGICATAIMWEALRNIGAEAMPFIPKREEGYGMQFKRLTQFAKEGVALVITVDHGIVSFDKAQKAKKLGLDLIITDHHLPKKSKPEALVIVHTTKLSGAGVAWFFANHLRGESELDLATIGTVTDIMPLMGPNRCLVKYGLKALAKTKRTGLQSLYKFAGIKNGKLGTYEIGYIIGPRLNAAGRLDDPMDSLRLLCTTNKNRGENLARVLDQKNRQRQVLMEKTTNQAREVWLKEDGKSQLIFLSHRDFHEGVVGLVAGKLTEEFYRPAVVIAEGLEPARASARSIVEFNIVEAIRECADILGDHGGHALAAGFSVESAKITLVKERLTQIAENKLKNLKLSPTLRIDLEIPLGLLNLEIFKLISSLEPFGEANPQPVFCSHGVKVLNSRAVGQEGKHLALELGVWSSEFKIRAIGFNLGHLLPQISPDKSIDIAYNLILDEWNGNQRLQLKLKDIHLPEVSSYLKSYGSNLAAFSAR